MDERYDESSKAAVKDFGECLLKALKKENDLLTEDIKSTEACLEKRKKEYRLHYYDYSHYFKEKEFEQHEEHIKLQEIKRDCIIKIMNVVQNALKNFSKD